MGPDKGMCQGSMRIMLSLLDQLDLRLSDVSTKDRRIAIAMRR